MERHGILGRIKSKLRRSMGETLVETLAGTLILSMAMMILPGAIIVAARINANAKTEDNLQTAFATMSGNAVSDGDITITYYSNDVPGISGGKQADDVTIYDETVTSYDSGAEYHFYYYTVSANGTGN